MGEAFSKSHETTEEETEEMQSFLDSTQRDHQLVLSQAFKMIEEDQAGEAKTNLRKASKELNQTRIEISERASEIQKKL